MTKRYAFTHPAIQGQVILEYQYGFLTFYRLDGEAEASVINNFLLRLPIKIEMLSKISTNAEAKFTEIEIDLSFERFMRDYKHRPAGYSKATAERKWSKLTQADKQEALKFIPTYDRELTRTGVAKKYPETYINQRIWQK
jgi:hypothetical protein